MKSLRTLSALAVLVMPVATGPLLHAVEIDSLSNFTTDFEAEEGYTPGYLASDPFWNIDGDSLPEIGSFAYSGLLGLSLDGQGAISIDFTSLGSQDVGWVDLYLKPVFSGPEDLATAFPLGQAALTGFVQVGADGEIYVLHGDGLGNGMWIETGYAVALNGTLAVDWLRMTYRLDYLNQSWDLYLNDTLQMIDIGFVDSQVPPLSRFYIAGSEDGSAQFDQFTAGFNSPIFTDADNDGIDDAYEVAQGLSTLSNDRYGDRDFDSIPNLYEYMDGLEAGNPDSDGDGVNDGEEIKTGANPLVADSYDLEPLPFREGFETYVLGDLSGQSRWQIAGGSALVQSQQSFTGTQALELMGGQSILNLENNFDGSDANPVWIDFKVQPVRYLDPSEEEANNALNEEVTAAFYFIEESRIAVLDGNGQGGGNWHVVEHAPAAGEWTRVIVKNDYQTQQFRIWVNDVLVEGSFGFANTAPYFTRFAAQLEEASSAYLDQIYVGDQEPSSFDADDDGMDDTWEQVIIDYLEEQGYPGLTVEDIFGTDPAPEDGDTTNDYLWDADGDGIPNLVEHELGKLPTVADADVDYYADAGQGDDLVYNGLSAVPGKPSADHGPKVSVTGAIDAAVDTSRILILEGIYDETILSLDGKNLIIRPAGNVIIR